MLIPEEGCIDRKFEIEVAKLFLLKILLLTVYFNVTFTETLKHIPTCNFIYVFVSPTVLSSFS